jgi:hypothetical protein
MCRILAQLDSEKNSLKDDLPKENEEIVRLNTDINELKRQNKNDLVQSENHHTLPSCKPGCDTLAEDIHVNEVLTIPTRNKFQILCESENGTKSDSQLVSCVPNASGSSTSKSKKKLISLWTGMGTI